MASFGIRQIILLTFLFIATSLTFIALDNRQALDPLRNGLHGLISPVAQRASDLGQDRAPGQESVDAELAAAREENDTLRAENARLKAQNDEIEDLRALAGLIQDRPDLETVAARVINVDPTSTDKFIVIDKGSLDGIERGMAVVDPTFYIGRVTEVEETSARVALAIDITQAVGAEIQDSGAAGIAYGAWQVGGRIELRYVERDVDVEAGQWVTTSCKSQVRSAQVPCGLIIGQVEGDPERNNQTDTQTIRLLPAANFDDVRVVAVIVSDDEA